MLSQPTSPIPPIVQWPNYVCICVLSALNLVVLVFSRAELLTEGLPMYFLQGIVLLAMLVTTGRMLGRAVPQKVSFVRLHYAFEGLLFLHIAWLNLRMLNHLSMMLPFPYADHLLNSWDQALNLDWLTYFNAIMAQPLLFQLLDIAYTSLTPLSIVILLLLVSLGYISRAREFISAFFITAVICIIIGAAFPAKAAVITLIPDLSIFAHLSSVPGSYHIHYMEVLRDPSVPVTLDPAQLPGLVTFPSFHTASGILIISACRKTWLSVPAWTYSIMMIAATPVHGGHYVIDLIAGAVVALLVIKLVRHLNRNDADSTRLLQSPV